MGVMRVMTNFKTQMQILKPNRGLWGKGQGQRGQNFDMNGKVLSQGMCVSNIKGTRYTLIGMEVMNSFRNLNADFGT